jgi:phospholipid/cholesterol/gamma-HCH transport system substrate-binding protein
MRSLLRENVGEAIVGVAVVVLAVWFVVFAWGRTGGGRKAGAIEIAAIFPNASGVNVGTDVRVAGLKVGSVSALSLDPQTYQVKVAMALDPTVKLPADSSASVTSEGLLGSTFVAFTPGGSPTMLRSGDTITDTQGSMDLMALIGQFINRPSSGGSSGEAAGEPATSGR